MLDIRSLSLYLNESGRPLVEQFRFSLNRGDRAVIIGEEGNGKSTLLKYLYAPALVEDYCTGSGQVFCRGRMGYLPQLLSPKEMAQNLEAFFSGYAPYQVVQKLTEFGLPPELADASRPLSSLSGGERIKVQLVRLLLDAPEVLLLDEPTNDLDVEALEWLEGFLLQSRTPVLYISHDETLIENTANVIIHLEQLRRKTICRATVSRESYSDYRARRSYNFDKQTQIAQKQRDDYARQQARWQQIHDRVEHEQATISRGDPHGGRLLKKKMKAVKSQQARFQREAEDFLDFPDTEDAILTHFPADIQLPAGKVVLDLSLPELRVEDRLLARDLRLFVSGGSHIGITGRNGAGKSTLLEHLWQLLKDRRDLTVCYMPQDYSRFLDYDQSPIQHLGVQYSKDTITQARTYLGSMRFTHEEMTGKIGALSGGQRAKLLFTDMVLKRADVLLLDEPTRNFSPLSCPVVRQALREFGGAIISVSHDRKFLQDVCQQVYILQEDGLFLK